ncbi:hypothetical protein [Nocardia callitridis]|uniref:hypothetical protein n=1 Tax=Nocardia callitridis TaxID=648753 RepID=UPI0031E9EA8C
MRQDWSNVTMSGNARHEIVVSGGHFKVIRQLTLQLANVSPEILDRWGWSVETKKLLKQLVRSVPFEIEASSRIRIILTDQDIHEALASEHHSTAQGGDRERSVVTRYLPKKIGTVWPPLLEDAFRFLGGEEARYRTGFYPDEIADALTAFSEPRTSPGTAD